MRKELGLLVVESSDGDVRIQMSENVERFREMFDNLRGKPSEKPYRATFVGLDFAREGSESVAGIRTVMLPVIESADEGPDGFVIGEGPVRFKVPDEE